MATYCTEPAVEVSLPPSGSGGFSLHVYPTGTTEQYETPAFLQVLETAVTPTDEQSLRDRCSAVAETDGERLFDRLVAAGALTTDLDGAERRREWIERKWHQSLFFHVGEDTSGHEEASGEPIDFGRSASEIDVSFPEPRSLPNGQIADLTEWRRTRRQYDGTALSPRQLSTVFSHWIDSAVAHREVDPAVETAGKYDADDFPVGVYPIVCRVAEIDPGVYEYRPRRNGLRRIESLPDAETANETAREFVANQPWIDGVALVVFFTVRIDDYAERFSDAASYPELYTHASAHAHRLQLTANALGYSVFQSAAIQDGLANEQLGVDGETETVGYAVAIGRSEHDADRDRPTQRVGGER